jgi:hypothetical protein
MEISYFVHALQEARTEARSLDARIAEIHKLQVRRDILTTFISIAEAVIAGDMATGREEMERLFPEWKEEEPSENLQSGTDVREDRLWKVLQTILQLNKYPMTAGEILEQLLKTDKKAVQGEHQRETVRNAMSRKPDVFEKVSRGLFVLKDWPEQLKAAANRPLPPLPDDSGDDAG